MDQQFVKNLMKNEKIQPQLLENHQISEEIQNSFWTEFIQNLKCRYSLGIKLLNLALIGIIFCSVGKSSNKNVLIFLLTLCLLLQITHAHNSVQPLFCATLKKTYGTSDLGTLQYNPCNPKTQSDKTVSIGNVGQSGSTGSQNVLLIFPFPSILSEVDNSTLNFTIIKRTGTPIIDLYSLGLRTQLDNFTDSDWISGTSDSSEKVTLLKSSLAPLQSGSNGDTYELSYTTEISTELKKYNIQEEINNKWTKQSPYIVFRLNIQDESCKIANQGNCQENYADLDLFSVYFDAFDSQYNHTEKDHLSQWANYFNSNNTNTTESEECKNDPQLEKCQTKLIYYEEPQSNSRIMDFSQIGFKQKGNCKLPNNQDLNYTDFINKIFVEPEGPETDRENIQSAIDQICDASENILTGYKGFIYLNGNYTIKKYPLHIHCSNIMLRGMSQAFDDIEQNNTNYTNLEFIDQQEQKQSGIVIKPKSPSELTLDTTIYSNQENIPMGSSSFLLDSTDLLNVNDYLEIKYNIDSNFIQQLGLSSEWNSEFVLKWERKILKIEDDNITLDNPITHYIPQAQAIIKKIKADNRLENIGIENIQLITGYSGTDTFTPNCPSSETSPKDCIMGTYGQDQISSIDNFCQQSGAFDSAKQCSDTIGPQDNTMIGYDGIIIDYAKNVFVRNISCFFFAHSCVTVESMAKQVSVIDSKNLDPISIIKDGYRQSFLVKGQLVFMSNLYDRNGINAFTTGEVATGPTVFQNCVAQIQWGNIGPSSKYASGQLYDNVKGGQMGAWNKQEQGNNAGWTGVNQVFWNSESSIEQSKQGIGMTISSTEKLGGWNWAIGCISDFFDSGDVYSNSVSDNQQNRRDHNHEQGPIIFESFGQNVVPKSLYQLQNQFGNPECNNNDLTCENYNYIEFPYLKECLPCNQFVNDCETCDLNNLDNYNNLYQEFECKSFYSCESGSFYNPNEKKCQNCSEIIDECAECVVTPNTTLNQFHFTQVKCKMYLCEPGEYFNSSMMDCLSCSVIDQCTKCVRNNDTDKVICQQCKDGFPISDGSACIYAPNSHNCEPQQYFKEEIPQCKACAGSDNDQDQNCKLCHGEMQLSNKTLMICDECVSTYIVDGNTGKCKCNQNEVYDILEKECKKCGSIMQDCIECGQDASSYEFYCNQCFSNYTYNKQAKKCQDPDTIVYECPYNMYYDQVREECYKCNSVIGYCVLCANISNTIKCTECDEGYYLNQTENECKKCSSNCKKCKNYNYCQACEDQYYRNEQGMCAKCDTYLNGKCDSCVMDYEQNTAVCTQCDSEYYLNYTSKECIDCNQLDQKCIECGLVLGDMWATVIENKTIVEDIKNNNINYLKQDLQNVIRYYTTNPICFECEQTHYPDGTECIECSQEVEHCSLCHLNILLNEQQQEFEFNVYCDVCDDDYMLNKITNKCTKCTTEQYVINGECEYCSNAIDQCIACDYIQNRLSCNLCKDKYTTYNDEGTYKCMSCSNYDSRCIGCTSETCKFCLSPYVFTAKNNCTTCDVVIEHCSSCHQIYDNSSTTSIGDIICDECSTGYYYNKQTNKCESCALNELQIQDGVCKLCSNILTYCSACSIRQGQQLSQNPSDDDIKQATQCDECKAGYILLYNKTCASCNQEISYCKSCSVNNNKFYCNECIDGYFYNDTSKQCQKCNSYDPNCYNCSFSNQNFICYSCKSGLFYHSSYQKCVLCNTLIENCYNCIGTDSNLQCTGCNSGYLLFNNSNICSKCMYHQYSDNYGNCFDCQSKVSNCKYCNYNSQTTNVQCSTCFYGYGLNSTENTCKECSNLINNCKYCDLNQETKKFMCSICNTGYYYEQISSQCALCDNHISGCISCYKNQLNSLICSECISSKTLKDNLCINCASNEYLDSNTCYTCQSKIPYCQSCSLKNGKVECSSCQYGYVYYNDSCISCSSVIPKCTYCKIDQSVQNVTCQQCSSGYYDIEPIDQNIRTCKTCSSSIDNCLTCSYDYSNVLQCTQCSFGYLLKNGKCSSCSIYEFFDNNMNTCFSCNNNLTNCLTCNYNQKQLICTQCYTSYTYNQVDNQCQKCNEAYPHCSYCEYSIYIQSLECKYCDYGYYQGQDGSCYACLDKISGCQLCSKDYNTDSFICAECIKGRFLSYDKKSCIKCKPYEYQVDNQCVSCHKSFSGCAFCNSTSCQKCFNSYYLDNGDCKSCSSGCDQCELNNGVVKCLSCEYGMQLLSDNTCSSCREWQFADVDDSNNCKNCHTFIPNCRQCSDKNTCNLCYFGYSLSDDKSSCNDCTGKIANCLECLGSQCLKCQQGYSLQQDYSCSKCKTNEYFSDQNKCEVCKKDYCATCKADGNCKQCIGSHYLNNEQKCIQCNSAITSCEKCYMNQTLGKLVCQDCGVAKYFDYNMNLCVECSAQLRGCSQCIQDSYNKTFVCYACETGYYYDTQLKLCIKCSDSIAGCSDCRYDQYYGAVCDDCQIGYIRDYTDFDQQCIKQDNCHKYCKSCYQEEGENDGDDSIIKCKECYNGYIINPANVSQCVPEISCPNGQFQSGNQCYSCNDKDIGEEGCHLCKSHFSSSYFDNLACYQCRNDYELEYFQFNTKSEYFCINKTGTQNCPAGCTKCTQGTLISKCTECNVQLNYYKVEPHYCKLNCTKVNLEGCKVCSYKEQNNYIDYNNYNQLTTPFSQTEHTQALCTECYSGYSLIDGKCQKNLQVCEKNYTFHDIDQNCVKCSENCMGCKIQFQSINGSIIYETYDQKFYEFYYQYVGQIVEKKICLQCYQGYYLNANGKCIFDQTQDEVVLTENICEDACQSGQCSWNTTLNYMKCTQCKPGLTLKTKTNGQQYCACDASQLTECSECVWSVSQNSTICTKCNDGAFIENDGKNCKQQNSSVSCSNSQYYQPEKEQCQNCNDLYTNCSRCEYDNTLFSTQCQYCDQGYYLNAYGSCSFKYSDYNCVEGYYEENYLCKKCAENCKVCYSQYECSECDSGYEANLVDITQEQCIKIESLVCAVGYYEDSNKNCIACHSNCKSCFYDINNTKLVLCQECKYSGWQINSKGVCLNPFCDTGYVFNKELGCVKCPNFCNKCQLQNGQYLCLAGQCYENYTLVNEQCVLKDDGCTSQIGKTLATINNNKICLDCPVHCTVCEYKINTQKYVCSSCESGYAINEYSYCEDSTLNGQDGKYYGYDKEINALGIYYCGLGVSKCYYEFSYKKLIAVSCDTQSYTLENEICVPKNKQAECIQDRKMLKYISGYGYMCVSCTIGCFKCYYDENNQKEKCTTCESEYKKDSNDICQLSKTNIPTCTNNQRLDLTTQVCTSCPSYCKKCDNKLDPLLPSQYQNIICSECIDGYYYSEQFCFKNCPEKTYTQINSNSDLTQQCVACQQYCTKCQAILTNPPKIVCYACESGYYISNNKCITIPKCEKNQYLIYYADTSSSGEKSYTPKCLTAQSGCLYPKANDVYNQKTDYICGTCESQYILNSKQKCVDYYITTRPTCESGYYTKFANNKWDSCKSCESAMTGCSLCEVENNCLTCKIGYYISVDTNTKFAACKSISTLSECSSGKTNYLEKNIQTNATQNWCIDCPYKCDNCYLSNIFDKYSMSCIKCTTDYTLTQGECIQEVKTTTKISQACSSTEYPIILKIAGMESILCGQCKDINCQKCHLVDPYSMSELPICEQCMNGYTLKNYQCIPNCLESEYYNTQNTKCDKCDVTCKTCTGYSIYHCSSCNENLYKLQPDGQCKKIELSTSSSNNNNNIQNQINCGTEAQLDLETLECQCIDSINYYWDIDKKKCVSFYSYIENVQCSLGEYKNSSNKCVSCQTLNNDQNCAICTSSKCTVCKSGYFLNTTTNKCTSCSSGCDVCTSQTVCQKCKTGYLYYYYYKQGKTLLECVSGTCPTGSLLSIPSAYTENSYLWTNSEFKTNVQTQGYTKPDFNTLKNEIDSETDINKQIIALDKWGYPIIYKYKNKLPWTMNSNKQPVARNQIINLICKSCIKYCDICDKEYLQIWDDTSSDHKSCIFSQYCPSGYEKSYNLEKDRYICTKIVEIDKVIIAKTDLSSLNIKSEQVVNKDVYFELFTNYDLSSDSNLKELAAKVKWEWSLESIDIYTNVRQHQFTYIEQITIQNTVKKNINLNKNYLYIPQSQLTTGVIYKFKVKASYNGYESTQIISFPCVNYKQYYQLSDLGVQTQNVIVSPTTGISGITTFSVSVQLQQIPLIYSDQKNWHISLIVNYLDQQFSESVIYNFENLDDSINFILIQNTTHDYTSLLTIQLQKLQSIYKLQRKILVTKNTQFDIDKSELVNDAIDSTKDSSYTDMVSASNMIKQQAISIIQDDSNLVNKVTKITNKISAKIDQIQNHNVDSVTSIIHSSTYINNLGFSLLRSLLSVMTRCVNKIQKQSSTRKAFSALYGIQRQVLNSRTNARMLAATTEDQVMANDIYNQKINIGNQAITQATPGSTVQFITDEEDQQIYGVYLDRNIKNDDEDEQSFSQSGTKSNIKSSVTFNSAVYDTILKNQLSNKKQIIGLQNINPNILEGSKKFDNIISGDVIEVQIFTSEGTSIKFDEKNSNECLVKAVFTFHEDIAKKSKDLDQSRDIGFKCGHFDKDKFEFVIDNTGTIVKDSNNIYTLTCCYNHMSTYAALYPPCYFIKGSSETKCYEYCPTGYIVDSANKYCIFNSSTSTNPGVGPGGSTSSNPDASYGSYNQSDSGMNCQGGDCWTYTNDNNNNNNNGNNNNGGTTNPNFPSSSWHSIVSTGCHYTCSQCYERAESKYEGCLQCAMNHSQITQPLSSCVCDSGYVLDGASCVEGNTNAPVGMQYFNGAMNLFTIGMIFTGVPFPITWKVIDFSQLYSLYYFSGSPNFEQYQDLYKALRMDNLAPIIPNAIGDHYEKTVGLFTYLNVDYQEPPYGFMDKQMSANFIVNMFPLLICYGVVLIISLILYFIPANTPGMMQFVKNNFIWNGYLMLFLITMQEEVLLISLQFYNLDFSNTLNVFGFILALLAAIHVVSMIIFIAYTIFKTQRKMSNRVLFLKVEKSGTLVNRYALLIFLFAKFFAVISFVLGNSTLNLCMYGFIIFVFIMNDIIQFRNLSYWQRLMPLPQLILQIFSDVLLIPLYIGIFFIEQSKTLTTVTSGQLVDQEFVAVFVYVFIGIKVAITFADFIINLKEQKKYLQERKQQAEFDLKQQYNPNDQSYQTNLEVSKQFDINKQIQQLPKQNFIGSKY